MTKKEKKLFDLWLKHIDYLNEIKTRHWKDLNALFEKHLKMSPHDVLEAMLNNDLEKSIKREMLIHWITYKEMIASVNECESLRKRMKNIGTVI